MNVYVVIHSDRHTDPEPQVYSDRENAIFEASVIIDSYASEGYEVEEVEINRSDWLYYATYGNEGDAVWVLERPLR